MVDNEKEMKSEIELLKTDILSLKSCLIGLDGKNGLKQQINSLHKELETLKNANKEIIELMTGIRIQQKSCPFVYSTKEENNQLKTEILDRLDKMEQTRRTEFESFRKERNSQNQFMETVKYTRWSLYLAFIALIVSIIFNVLSTRGLI